MKKYLRALAEIIDKLEIEKGMMVEIDPIEIQGEIYPRIKLWMDHKNHIPEQFGDSEED
jgi:hypothetical protein